MFVGKQLKSKGEIVILIIIVLLLEGKLDSSIIKKDYNISSKTFSKYISFIKNVLFDFGIYYIDIYFDRDSKMYKCKIYS